MILLFDIGNTTVNFAVAKDNEIIANYNISSDLNKTSDEFYIQLKQFIDLTKITNVVIASVVPKITLELVKLVEERLKIVPLLIQPKTKTGVKVKTDNPREVGADLIAVAAEVVSENESTLIIDLGTATKYIYVKNNAITGVIITAGVEISINALTKNTALLPKIDIKVPNKVLETNTISCMQSGVTYGVAAQVDGLISLIKEEVKEDFKVITTGGFSNIIIPLIKHEQKNDPLLIFKGLLKIFKLNER